MSDALNEIQRIRRCPQSQDSLHAQLILLRDAAIRLGLYDADDWVFMNMPLAAAGAAGRATEEAGDA